MKRGRQATPQQRAEGYTIVETLIFLAVSGLLFTSVMIMVNGQQARTEFTQAVRTFEASIQDIANDVSTGNAAYPFPAGQSCKVNATGVVTIDSAALGSNQRCIFVGRVIQFVPGGTDQQTYSVYTVVGRQRVAAGGNEVTSLAEATPVALAPGTGARAGIPNLARTEKTSAAARVGRVTYQQGGVTTDAGSFGFFTTFQSYNTSGSINSNSTQVDVAPVSGSTLNQSPTSLVDRIDAHRAATPTLTPLNPNGGLTICLLSNGSTQRAIMKVGGTSTGRLTVTTQIENGNTCP